MSLFSAVEDFFLSLLLLMTLSLGAPVDDFLVLLTILCLLLVWSVVTISVFGGWLICVGMCVYCVRGYWCTWLCNVVWFCKVCFRGACFYVCLPFLLLFLPLCV
jgi:hypothetical protein